MGLPYSSVSLNTIGFQVIRLAIFDKSPAGTAEYKSNLICETFIMERLHPFIMTRACSTVVLTVTQHLLYLTACKVLLDAYRPYERSAHDSLMLKR